MVTSRHPVCVAHVASSARHGSIFHFCFLKEFLCFLPFDNWCLWDASYSYFLKKNQGFLELMCSWKQCPWAQGWNNWHLGNWLKFQCRSLKHAHSCYLKFWGLEIITCHFSQVFAVAAWPVPAAASVPGAEQRVRPHPAPAFVRSLRGVNSGWGDWAQLGSHGVRVRVSADGCESSSQEQRRASPVTKPPGWASWGLLTIWRQIMNFLAQDRLTGVIPTMSKIKIGAFQMLAGLAVLGEH